MKYFLTLAFLTTFSMALLAQAPNAMSYQAVVRDADNELLSNQSVGMRISILQGSANGPAVYVETQNRPTNTNGLVSLQIGNGTPVSGSFANIDWSTGTYFIETATDPNGGTDYSIIGTSQLMSVPYALYAERANIPSRKRSISITPAMINSTWKSSSDIELVGLGGWIHTAIKIPEGGTSNFTISIPVPADYAGGGFTAKAIYSSDSDEGQFDCSVFARGRTIGEPISAGTGGGGLVIPAPVAVETLAVGTTQLAAIGSNPEVLNIHFARRSESDTDTATGSLFLLGLVLEYND